MYTNVNFDWFDWCYSRGHHWGHLGEACIDSLCTLLLLLFVFCYLLLIYTHIKIKLKKLLNKYSLMYFGLLSISQFTFPFRCFNLAKTIYYDFVLIHRMRTYVGSFPQTANNKMCYFYYFHSMTKFKFFLFQLLSEQAQNNYI